MQIATRIIFGGYAWLTSENYGELRPENIYSSWGALNGSDERAKAGYLPLMNRMQGLV